MQGVRQLELSGAVAGAAPLMQSLARGTVFKHPCVAIAVSDEKMTIPRKRDVCGAVERATLIRLFSDRNREQLLA